MQHSPSWKANFRSLRQETIRLAWNVDVHYHLSLALSCIEDFWLKLRMHFSSPTIRAACSTHILLSNCIRCSYFVSESGQEILHTQTVRFFFVLRIPTIFFIIIFYTCFYFTRMSYEYETNHKWVHFVLKAKGEWHYRNSTSNSN
jgi:hypothetical protein